MGETTPCRTPSICKNEKSDLSQAERNAVGAALVRFEDLIKTGMIR
jgi:hypothetical protein